MSTRFLAKESSRVLLLPFLLLIINACSEQTPSGSPETAQMISETSATESIGYKRINTTNEDDPLNTHIYELDNGLRVYLTENHEEPRFYAEVVVRVGSKNDPEDTTGLAHYLEHLLFKGTQELGTVSYTHLTLPTNREV